MMKVETFQMASWDAVHSTPWEQQKRLTINVMNQLELRMGAPNLVCNATREKTFNAKWKDGMTM